MRVRATALGSPKSNAIGQVELSCSPGGLIIGLYGVGAYSQGYALGALSSGTQLTLPYSVIQRAEVRGRELYLELRAEGFPHDRLVLSQFSAGPGVPLTELRRRRLILHVSALSFAAVACLAAALFVPTSPKETLAWGALLYGALAGSLVLVLGFALDRSLYVRPPREDETRMAFVGELARYVPHLATTAPIPSRRLPRWEELVNKMPRSAVAVGILIAAGVLTLVVGGQRILTEEPRTRLARVPKEQTDQVARNVTFPQSVSSEPHPSSLSPSSPSQPPAPEPRPVQDGVAENGRAEAKSERNCVCDRADSELWKNPIPRLSSLLIERRAIVLPSYTRTELEVAVINNGDSPIDDITLHVQFYERKGKERRATKERPLYFEGPLRPGEAVKWSTKARGTEFEIATPDLGVLGPGGTGAASAAAFVKLLDANHRPVRLHAARLLSFLGDSRAREAALHLKDAMRAAEAPYLRRLLVATGTTRICDVEVRKGSASTVGACVYNAAEQAQAGLGLQVNELSASLDVDHPLADPPELVYFEKWKVDDTIEPQAGKYVRVTLPANFLKESNHSLEVMADRFDLLD